MMPSDRFDRRLPTILGEISQPRVPDYFDDLLGQTARTRQRPAWTLLERWLPIVDVTRLPAFAWQVPWRAIAVLTLIVLLLVASLAFVIGSQHTVPAPFGPAHNGLIVYAKDGDIYTADPVTGTARAIVTGPETDLRPIFSLDGTRFVFERMVNDLASTGRLFVANADGTGPIAVTPDPLSIINSYAFSPDGREILVSTGPYGATSLLIARSDGSSVRTEDTGGLNAIEPAWRPPNGDEILFSATDISGYDGLYAVDAASGKIRTILQPSLDRYRGGARRSPDGSQVAFNEWVGSDNQTARIHIVSADGTRVRMQPRDRDAMWEAFIAWSNDGRRLASIRGYEDRFADVRVVVLPADGRDLGVEVDFPGSVQLECCSSWEWAPDDSSILGTPVDASGKALPQVMLDPDSGAHQAVPWTTNSYPAWQRVAR